jgi:hypothetical protein
LKRRIILAIIVLAAGGFLLVLAVTRGKLQFGTRRAEPLQTIFKAQVEYAREHPDKGFATSFEDLAADPGGPMIDAVLESQQKSGYDLILWTAGPDARGRVHRFFVVARPQDHQEGQRSFFIDQTGIERSTAENRAATAADPPVN